MTTRYDEAAREARQRVKAAGQRDLVRLQQRHPVGQVVKVGEGRELKRKAYVRGHELSTVYRPLVVTTAGVYFSYEVEDFVVCRICEALEREVEATCKCGECGALVCEAHGQDGICDMCS